MIGMEITTQILFWFAFFDTFLVLSGLDSQRILLFIVIAVVQVITGVIRKKCNKLSTFLLGHVLVAAGIIFLLFGVFWAPFLGVSGLINVLFSALLRSANGLKEIEKPNLVYLVVLAILYFVNVYEKNSMGRMETYWCFFGILILKLVYSNFAAIDQYIFDRKSSTKIEVGHLKKISRSMSLIYAAALTILLGAVSFLRTEGISEFLLEQLKRFLIWLLHFAPEGEQTAEQASQNAVQQMELGTEMAGDIQETSMFAEILDQILINVTKIIIVVLVIAVIWLIIVTVYKNFYQKKDSEDVEEFIFKEEKKSKLSKNKKMERNRFFEQDPKKRIRKVYQKKMYGFWGKKKQPPVSLTPKEQIQMQFELDQEKRNSKVQDLYEKARYSEEKITKEDVKILEDLFEKKKKK